MVYAASGLAVQKIVEEAIEARIKLEALATKAQAMDVPFAEHLESMLHQVLADGVKARVAKAAKDQGD